MAQNRLTAVGRVDPSRSQFLWNSVANCLVPLAVLRAAPECDLVVTSDFFAAPLDDPYLVGRIAAVNALSDVFATGGQPTAAIAQYQAYLGAGATDTDALVSYGLALVSANRVAEGLQTFKRAVATNGRHVAAHLMLGRTLAAQGQLAQAADEFQTVIELDPRREDARQYLQQLHGAGAIPRTTVRQ